ncbi:hypothetical protein BDN72DRAFT_534449 [Pluteus cervinus]|uniref:Uncharacterized protein n=1 Tax=Pluteus cervinus TaxID=181527 RepID=A0ACD3A6A9_9AGAR|nr:hypothetical protein BDN72DRAFT_534449 [Pluteus cervinus]
MNTLIDSVLEPRFPLDIEQLIFEDVARNNRGSIPKLMLVCHRVKHWTQSILYAVIIRNESPLVPQKYYPPVERLSAYAHFVHHLLAFFEIGNEDLQDHLRLCEKLTNVALWCSTLSLDALRLLEGLPNLRQLVIHLSAVFPSGPPYNVEKSPAFRMLTHLELLDDVDKLSWNQLRGLAKLNNLTHLALNSVQTEPVVRSILEDCKGLRVLLLHDSGQLNDDANFEARVVFVCYRIEDYIRDWIALAEGRWCSWDDAKKEVRARREPGKEYEILRR